MSTLTFSLIQTDLHWEDKKANLQMLEEKIRSIKEKTEVVVLPEMFSTGFSMDPERLSERMDGETVKWMQRLATEKKVIIAGSFIAQEKGKSADNKRRFYNRLLWVLPNGSYGVYDKRHRFAYAEEDKYYEAGDKRLIASVKGWKINLLICYDLRFPVWARQHSEPEKGTPEFDVLIYVANWPEKRIEAWKTLLKARAIENQCYVIGVNRIGKDGKEIVYTGESMVVGPLGDILYYKKDEEDIHTITLEKEHLEEVRKRFPFWKDADGFQLIP
jgi:omega-amidase